MDSGSTNKGAIPCDTMIPVRKFLKDGIALPVANPMLLTLWIGAGNRIAVSFLSSILFVSLRVSGTLILVCFPSTYCSRFTYWICINFSHTHIFMYVYVCFRCMLNLALHFVLSGRKNCFNSCGSKLNVCVCHYIGIHASWLVGKVRLLKYRKQSNFLN